MNIQLEKYQLIQQIIQIKDESLVSALKGVLEFGLKNQSTTEGVSPDFWDELTEAQKLAIEVSIQQLKDGKGIPNETVMTDFRKQYAK